MLGRAVNLTLPYQSEGDYDLVNADTQRPIDYLPPNLVNDLDDIRTKNRDGSYIWGKILDLDLNEDLRIVNLEASPSYTTVENPSKLTYHVHADNLPLVFSQFTRPLVISLANNHALDMGRPVITMKNMIGLDYQPAVVDNIKVYAFATGCSGVPASWSKDIAYLPPIVDNSSVSQALNILSTIIANDSYIKVVTIHWGPNFAHKHDGQEFRRKLAHRVIDELGVDLIHGHSSHHLRGLELYNNKLIVYGAGDFINDYEQISSEYPKYGALFVVDLDTEGNLMELQLLPTLVKDLRVRLTTDNIRSYVNEMSRQDAGENALLF